MVDQPAVQWIKNALGALRPGRPGLHPRLRLTCRDVHNAFTGAALDRAGDSRRRDPSGSPSSARIPGARAVVAGDRGLRIADDRLELVPLAELNGAEPLLLGLDADGPVFAVDEDPPRDGRVPMVGSGGVRGEPPDGRRRRPHAACARPRRGSRAPTAASPPTPPRC